MSFSNFSIDSCVDILIASHSVHMWRYASKSNKATKSADHQQGWSADAVLETPCVLVTEKESPIIMYAILYKEIQ